VGRLGEHVAHGVHQLETRLVGSEIGVLWRCLRAVQFGQDLGERVPVSVEQSRSGGAQNGAQHLDPRPIRGRPSSFPAPTPKRPHPSLAGEACHLFGQPALSNPRFTCQQPEGAAAFGDLLNCCGEETDLTIASDD
jgi:hypothetical protein